MRINPPTERDLLAKAMTRSTKILGVPHSFALANTAFFVLLMLMSYLITQSSWCFVWALLALSLSHVLMMIASLDDEKNLSMLQALLTMGRRAVDRGVPGVRSYSPLTVTQKHVTLRECPVSKHVPYSHLLDDYTVVTHQGDVLQVLALDGAFFDTVEPQVIEANKQLRNRILYQLATPGLSVSFYTLRQPHTTYPAGDYSNEFARAFNERYKNSLQKKTHFQTSWYIVLLHKAQAIKKKKQKTASSYQTLQTLLTEHSLRLINLFHGFHCRRVGAIDASRSELLSFLSYLLNLENRPVLVPQQALNTYLPHKSLHFATRAGVVQCQGADGKSRYMALLSLKEYPDATDASMLDCLMQMQAELIVTQSFYFKHRQHALRELEKQQNKMAQTNDSLLLAADLDLAMEDLKRGSLAYGEHHITLGVVADSQHALAEAIHAVESKLNQDADLLLARETRGAELAFWAQLPGNYRYRMRASLISSLNVAGFANLHNYPKGRAHGNHWGEAITVLETLNGGLYYFNLHVRQVANSIFIGPMGSGKTLMLSALLTLTSKYGGWRYVFDKDQGMEVVVRALGGNYHRIEPGLPSKMAPLQLPDTPQNRAFLVLLLKQLLSSKAVLTTGDEKVIEKAVSGIYQLPQELRQFRHMAAFFGANIEGSLRERFDRWHTNGHNAWLFDNSCEGLHFNQRITGFDIGKLLTESMEELSTPTLMYLFHRLGENLDSSPTIAFVPEGWRALSAPLFKAQLEEWSKTPRKNNMALVLDTQSPAELAASAAGASVAREAATQVFFANESASWNDYRQFHLNEQEFHIIKEVLPAQDGHYFLLKQAGVSVIARLPLQGLEADIAVLSSSKAGVLLLDAIRERVGDTPAAWLPLFTTLSAELSSTYSNDFTRMALDFNTLWERVTCPKKD